MTRRLYACSSNAGKLREFRLAAGEWGLDGWQIEPLPALSQIEPPAETGTTFEENAAAKALYYSELASDAVFADDSGLEVTALGNAPGIYSARFAGPQATDRENNELLLAQLNGAADRTARFVCVIALAERGRLLATFRGAVEGRILDRAATGTGGFGYDPLFYYPPLGQSFAELTAEEKLAVSHRGAALRQLWRYLDEENHSPGLNHFG